MSVDDWFENTYRSKFQALLSQVGVVIRYDSDRAAVDTGLHLFVEEWRSDRLGRQQPYATATNNRIWFQLKGLHASTYAEDQYRRAENVSVSVKIDHLKYWYAAPEAVYLVVYVESVDLFIGVDVRELVDGRWGADFYRTMRTLGQESITVGVPANAVMDAQRVRTLTRHNSMRIDGPAFRGRPLGHRLDPLRSELLIPDSLVWAELAWRVLEAHDFRDGSRTVADDLAVATGVLYQTLLWQSPAFTEIGYENPDTPFRTEATPEAIHGPVSIVFDRRADRLSFSPAELSLIAQTIAACAEEGRPMCVFIRGRDLSGFGGLWRATMRNGAPSPERHEWHMVGIEALTYLVLVSTLVYREFAPRLSWSNVGYLN